VPQDAPGAVPQVEETAPTASFAELLIQWQQVQEEIDAKRKEFDRADDIVLRDSLRRAYSELIVKANGLLNQLRESGIKKIETEELTPVLARTILGIMLTTADALIAKGIDPAYWEAAAKIDRLSIEGKEVFEEIMIRHREQKADDLPIAKIITNRGEITVELFENESPNTVANFISLAKSGFYNGLKFHRVIEGFMAQTGDPKGDGSGGPDYTIADECNTPEARRHFTGVLSMANTGAPDSGGSQFFITFTRSQAVQGLDGKHTVFGRVISGNDILGRLSRTHESIGMSERKIPDVEPDTITKIEIVRDRGHEYVPVKIGQAAEAKPSDPPPTRPDNVPPTTVDPPITEGESDKQKDDKVGQEATESGAGNQQGEAEKSEAKNEQKGDGAGGDGNDR
jgi:cyclophilin family peptidyl-prolyl cis-trans isomerase